MNHRRRQFKVQPIPSPQQKMIGVNNRFGNVGVKKQQGSTSIFYDSLLLTPAQLTYEFFSETAARTFPLTNFKDTLQPQESMVMERIYLTLVSETVATGEFDTVRSLDLSTDPGFSMGEFDFMIDNNRVIKPIPVSSFFPEFNSNSGSTIESVFGFDSQIVIPPLLQIKGTIKFPAGFFTTVALENTYLRLTIEGPGAIFAPQSNF